MRSLVALVITLALVSTGCARYSANHRMGLLFAGGTATFVGALTAVDGATCSEGVAALECDDGSEQRSLYSGLALMGAGLVTFALAYYFKPKPADAPK
jgi:hypothetical protein